MESVCYVNPALLVRRPISELIALQEGRRKLGLLTPSRVAGHEKNLHHTELFHDACVLAYPAWHPPGPFEWPIPGPSFIKACFEAFREFDIIHVWAHFYPSNLLLMILGWFKRKRIILTMDALPGYSFSAGPVLDVLFKIYTWTLGRLMFGIPDAITLYGEALVPHAKRSGIDMRKVRVIPTGIMEREIPSRSVARRSVRKEFAIPANHRIVFYAGLLNPRKRIDDILSVAARLSKEKVTFLLAGDGPLRQRLEAKSGANVRFLGWRKDIFRLLAAADILFFPSAAEGLSGIVMEAMLTSTPVVTTRIPCTTDLITNGKEGLLCAVGDVAGLTRAVRKLLADRKLAARLGAAARKRMLRRYSWKRILPAYEALYSELGTSTS